MADKKNIELVRKVLTPGLLSRLLPIGRLPAESLRQIVDTGKLLLLPQGNILFRRFDSDGRVYYLIKGRLMIKDDTYHLSEWMANTQQARAPIDPHLRRRVNVYASERSLLVSFDGELVNEMLEKYHPDEDITSINVLSRQRNDQAWRLQIMLNSPTLYAVSKDNICRAFEKMEEVPCNSGLPLITQGEDLSEYFYLLLEGRCLVTRVVDEEEVAVAMLKPGDCFGEMALLYENRKRNSSVVMSTDGKVMRLHKRYFDRHMRHDMLTALEARAGVVEAMKVAQKQESAAKGTH